MIFWEELKVEVAVPQVHTSTRIYTHNTCPSEDSNVRYLGYVCVCVSMQIVKSIGSVTKVVVHRRGGLFFSWSEPSSGYKQKKTSFLHVQESTVRKKKRRCFLPNMQCLFTVCFPWDWWRLSAYFHRWTIW